MHQSRKEKLFPPLGGEKAPHFSSRRKIDELTYRTELTSSAEGTRPDAAAAAAVAVDAALNGLSRHRLGCAEQRFVSRIFFGSSLQNAHRAGKGHVCSSTVCIFGSKISHLF